jgi:uncharacterized ParB-like nuclease family protein
MALYGKLGRTPEKCALQNLLRALGSCAPVDGHVDGDGSHAFGKCHRCDASNKRRSAPPQAACVGVRIAEL